MVPVTFPLVNIGGLSRSFWDQVSALRPVFKGAVIFFRKNGNRPRVSRLGSGCAAYESLCSSSRASARRGLSSWMAPHGTILLPFPQRRRLRGSPLRSASPPPELFCLAVATSSRPLTSFPPLKRTGFQTALLSSRPVRENPAVSGKRFTFIPSSPITGSRVSGMPLS